MGDSMHAGRSAAAGRKRFWTRFDAGLGFFVRRGVAWLVDYALPASLMSVFYLCASLFYLDEATRDQGNLMLLCAAIALLLITTYLPWKTGATIGERMVGIEVIRRDGRPRALVQIFAQECVLKVACGPFIAAFYALDYVCMGLIVHRDPDHDPTLDFFLKVRVVPAADRAPLSAGPRADA